MRSNNANDNPQGSGLARFGQIATEALGWPARDDEFALLPLSAVLERLEDLYQKDLERFEKIADRIEIEEIFFPEVNAQLDAFSSRICAEAGLRESAKDIISCVPLEPAIFRGRMHTSIHNDSMLLTSHTILSTSREGWRSSISCWPISWRKRPNSSD